MKLWIQLFALMLVLSMGACSSGDIVTGEQNSQDVAEIEEIVAVISELNVEGIGSRTVINMGESSITKPVWADDDIIGIYPTTGDQLSFPIVDGVGTSTCTFNGGGWALKTSTAYTAYSPFNRAYYYESKEQLPVSMLGQKQVGNNSSAHLGKYDLQIAKGTTPESGMVRFAFEHQVCFIRMDLKAPITANWKSVILESDALFTTEASMDLSLEIPILTATSKANSVTLDLENVSTEANEIITAYMVVLPIDLTDKSLDVILVDCEGNRFRTTAVITNDYRNFKAGYARWITANDFPIVIHVKQAGTLSDFISNEDMSRITSLKLTGELNGDDIRILRTMCGYEEYKGAPTGSLEFLDLSKVSIVSGGDYYYNFKEIDLKYYSNNNIIGQYMFIDCNKLKKIILPDNITQIEYATFYGCSSLINIYIPEGTLKLGDLSFSGCSNLSKIHIPNSVTQIGYGAFSGCSSLMYAKIGNDVNLIGESAFYDCKSLTEINIPNKVLKIESKTFYNCNSLLNISFGNSITEIGDYAFYGCNLIENISFPSSLIQIKAHAFSGCSSINYINIPDKVTNIGYAAFMNCKSLVSLKIGYGVTSIGGCAFDYCSKLQTIYCYAIVPPYTAKFENIDKDAKLYVPKGTISAYRNSTWGDFLYISELED